jgi:hypothetical protein
MSARKAVTKRAEALSPEGSPADKKKGGDDMGL